MLLSWTLVEGSVEIVEQKLVEGSLDTLSLKEQIVLLDNSIIVPQQEDSRSNFNCYLLSL